VFPDIIKRPYLSVYSDTNLFQLATFFAIGPQIYADGLIVVFRQLVKSKRYIKEKKFTKEEVEENNIESPLGRIGGKHIILNILNPKFAEPISYYPKCLYFKKANNIMERITDNQIIEFKSSLYDVLEIFRTTKFAYLPIVETIKDKDNFIYHKTLAFITVRDFLRLFIETKNDKKSVTYKKNYSNKNIEEIKNTQIKEVCSELILVKEDDFLKDVISLMVSKGIRNLGIIDKKSNLLGIINDRNIVEFLLNPSLRTIAGCNENSLNMDGPSKTGNDEIISQIKIKKNLKISPVLEIEEEMLIKQASDLLSDPGNPYLVLKGSNRITTPWDIVMKEYYLKNR
jgi:CBS domain-containing protein